MPLGELLRLLWPCSSEDARQKSGLFRAWSGPHLGFAFRGCPEAILLGSGRLSEGSGTHFHGIRNVAGSYR